MVSIVKEDSLDDYTLWYKDAIIYELDIKGFYDTNEDGIGDFKGLTRKLDYLKDLGITAIWLLPFYPSPLKDDGYDIADYMNIHPQYGTLRDFKKLLNEAHKRGIRVITELVLNHTSDQHPWFQAARRAPPDSRIRNFYVWSDSPEKFKDARIIFKDFEISNWSWDPVGRAYYWHRFYSHQPDLNYNSVDVQKTILKVVDFWLGLGVDGLRLDAVPYLFEKEGTNCENLPETHAFLKELRRHVDSKFKSKLLLAEANQWPPDAAEYFSNGDECQMAFHFPLMPRMFMAIKTEDRFPMVEIMENTPKIPENCQWAIFLRNHDELTLEMVTDEERDYMYRVFASDRRARINLGIRRRLAPLLENDRRKVELMNILLFTLPGTPVLYRGDEIGMGDNYYLGDRNGVRTPMQWNADMNAGFSKANPQKLFLQIIIDPEYNYETINVENQLRQHSSLLWWMKRLIAISRKHFRAFGRGELRFLYPENNKILAFIRSYNEEVLLIALNLSRNPQYAELDLSEYEGYLIRELFGGSLFPTVKKSEFTLTFSPYGYYVFLLKKEQEDKQDIERKLQPSLFYFKLERNTQELLKGWYRENLETKVLPMYLKNSEWFEAKAREIEQVRVIESFPLEAIAASSSLQLMALEVNYKEGPPETYLLPIDYAYGEKAKLVVEQNPQNVITRLDVGKKEGLIYDASYDEEFHKSMISLISKKRRRGAFVYDVTYSGRDAHSEILGNVQFHSRKIFTHTDPSLQKSKVLNSTQNTTTISYNDTYVLKLFRKVITGKNAEIEIGSKLTNLSFPAIPSILGDIRYERAEAEPATIAALYQYVKNEGDAWNLCVDQAERFFEKVLAGENLSEPKNGSLWQLYGKEDAELAGELIDLHFIELLILMSKRIAEFHLALRDINDPEFKPERFGYLYQHALTKSMMNNLNRTLRISRQTFKPTVEISEELKNIQSNKQLFFEIFNAVRLQSHDVSRSRIHGNFDLKQLLYTGKDFVIINYEDLLSRPLEEKRVKASPLHDVADVMRSFHYAAYTALLRQTSIKPEDKIILGKWVNYWHRACSAILVKNYVYHVKEHDIAPKDQARLETLINAFTLDRAVYELGYELTYRPEWSVIPVRGIKEILQI